MESPQDVNVHGMVSRVGGVDDERQAMPSGIASEFIASANSGSNGSEAWLDDAVQGKVEDELERTYVEDEMAAVSNK